MTTTQSPSKAPAVPCGDRDAAWHDDITRQHWEHIRRLLARNVYLRHDSEDLAQLTFLTAWSCRDEVPQPALYWLIAVARNHLRNYWRTSKYHASKFQVFGDVEFVPDDRADLQQVNARLYAEHILSQLPELEARLLRAVYLSELSHAEAAQRLSLYPRQVSRRLRRALTMARRIAGAMEQESALPEREPSEQPQASPRLSVEMRLLLAEGYEPAGHYARSGARR